MKTVVCKFKCESKLLTREGAQIKMVPVTSGSPENDSFFRWTPYGEFTFGTINGTAAMEFIPGEEYFIQITRAEV